MFQGISVVFGTSHAALHEGDDYFPLGLVLQCRVGLELVGQVFGDVEVQPLLLGSVLGGFGAQLATDSWARSMLPGFRPDQWKPSSTNRAWE